MDYKVVDGVKYTNQHEWARQEGSAAVVGITDFAQHKLGEIVFVELPDLGADLEKGKGAAVIESVKAVADLYAPVDGSVTEVNEALLDEPELLNKDPFGEGWVFKMEIKDESQLAELMERNAYEEFMIKEEEEE